MRLGASSQYQYVKLDNYYFCLQQNFATLAWILFFRREDLLSIKPWLKKDVYRQTLSHNWNLFKNNLKTLIYFMQAQIHFRDVECVELPVYGQLSVPIHKGYKIFNLHSGVVTKIFDPDVNVSSIISEIDHLKKISQVSFAPSLRRWDSGERWYEEDYVRGAVASKHRATDSGTFLKAFFQEAAPCMKSLISFQRPVAKGLQAYIEELNGALDISRFPGWNAYPREADIFVNFISSTLKSLKCEGDRPVDLVFTHGDFCPANILSTKGGIRIIDWENSGYRSLLFDFYSYFFYRPVNIKTFSVKKMSSELNQSLPAFISGLDFNVTITDNVYRRLYYLEYLCKLVERLCTDKRLNIMDYIMRYIDAFNLFDQNCNDKAMGCQVNYITSTDSLINS